MKRRQFSQALAAAGALAAVAPFNVVRAQAQKLRVGVLLPRSGVQAGIGQDCHRGVEVGTGVLRALGLPALDIMSADTESNVDVARSRAERLIGEGAQIVVLGCTEIQLIMNDSNSPLPTLDSTRLLARAALRRAVGETSGEA